MLVVVELLNLVQFFCNPIDCSPPGSSVHGISWARTLEWVAIPFFRGSPQPGVEPASPALAGGSFNTESPGKRHVTKL